MAKELSNLELAELLKDLSAALTIKDPKKNKFRVIAYDNAATAIEHLSSEAKDLYDEGKLIEVSGIGASIAESLGELFSTGKSEHFDEILSGVPKAVFELMKIQGIGPKTAYRLVQEFKISDTSPRQDLIKIAQAGKIAELEGFGEKSQAEILKSLTEFKEDKSKRILFSYALSKAQEIIEWLEAHKAVEKLDVLGSLRRKVSTIGDIDLAVITTDPEGVINHFVSYPHTKRILDQGDKKASILVPGEIQIDLRVQPKASYGSLLQHFTGSKHHNIALREYALKKGLSLSEWGIRKVGDMDNKTLVTFEDEKSFYNYLGLDYIPPELREDTGEIEAALHEKLPNLIKLEDVRGDFQIHSSFDIETSHDLGGSTMEEVVVKANELGYEYISFTEHNPSQKGHTDLQIVEILKKKREKVDKLNYSLTKDKNSSVKKVFNSLEIDILPTGKLPVPDAGLELLDFALVSIHSSFDQPKAQMTERILSALAHPKVKIFAHPTGRLILKRESVEADWQKIFAYCAANTKFIELNADPARLDLPDFMIKEAKQFGVRFSLGTDAHNAMGLNNMLFGIYNAQRGWMEKSDIINTQSLQEVEKLLL